VANELQTNPAPCAINHSIIAKERAVCVIPPSARLLKITLLLAVISHTLQIELIFMFVSVTPREIFERIKLAFERFSTS